MSDTELPLRVDQKEMGNSLPSDNANGISSHREINQLVVLFKAGRYSEVESRAYGLLQQHPDFGFAWKALGVALSEQGKDAVPALLKASQLLPADPETYNNLGNALRERGQFDDAIVNFRRAIGINPGFVEAYCNLGNVQRDLSDMNAAVTHYQFALQIDPEFILAYRNLGEALQKQDLLDSALKIYRRGLQIKPGSAELFNHIGTVLRKRDQIDDALLNFHRALECRSDFPDAHNNIGNAFQDIGQLNEAVLSYRHAVIIEPGLANAYNNLGCTLQKLGRFDDAIIHYRRALIIDPNLSGAYGNLGCALHNLGKFNEAILNHRQALECKPDFAEAYNNLGCSLQELGQSDNAFMNYGHALVTKPDFYDTYSNLGSALTESGKFDDAMKYYRRALQIKPDFAEAVGNLLFARNYQAHHSAAMLRAEAEHFNDLVARQARPYSDWNNTVDVDRCLRIGLVSGDFRNHPVAYFTESILAELASHASDRLALVAYLTHPVKDALTERIQGYCCNWRDAVGLSDKGLAALIRDDGIDILIDMSGHTRHNRLPMFAWKPAPVQATWLGYFATTGVAAIDYLIADRWTTDEATDAQFTEKVWRLPQTRLCFTPPDANVAVSPLPALTNGYVTFGCFNRLSKVNNAVISLWAKILHAVPHSRLLLKSQQLDSEEERQRTLQRFALHGIDGSQLRMEGHSSRAEYLAAYQGVDIAFDPFPFPGGTTSVEALWMGVPVLTLSGERFLSRQGVGIIMNAGLPDWVALDADDYLTRAIDHAGNLQRLTVLRNGLRQQVLASPLFDAKQFAVQFEVALRGMWKKWCEQTLSRDLPIRGD